MRKSVATLTRGAAALALLAGLGDERVRERADEGR